ncbi:MAG: hypothetical protein ABW061_17640, partial [Polyangiaceae bacterium]
MRSAGPPPAPRRSRDEAPPAPSLPEPPAQAPAKPAKSSPAAGAPPKPTAAAAAAPAAGASHAPVPVAVSELSQAGRSAVMKTLPFGTNDLTSSDAPTLLKPSLPGDKNQAAVTRVQNAKDLIEACERELAQKPAPTPARMGRLHFEIARLCDSGLGDLA